MLYVDISPIIQELLIQPTYNCGDLRPQNGSPMTQECCDL